MAYRPKALVPGSSQLTTSAATYYTAGSGITTILQSATLTNTTSGAVTATVYRVPSGGSAGVSNALIYSFNIGPGEAYTCPELIGKVLNAGDTIQALASANTSVSFQVSGVEIP